MRETEPRDDDLLLAAAARGGGEAFALFYRRHLPAVLAFLLARVPSREVAADLAAETFAGALVACRRFAPGGTPALAWLLGIARNKLRESTRRRRWLTSSMSLSVPWPPRRSAGTVRRPEHGARSPISGGGAAVEGAAGRWRWCSRRWW